MKFIFSALLFLATLGLACSAIASSELTSKIIPIIAIEKPISGSKAAPTQLAHAQITPDLSNVKTFTTNDIEALPQVFSRDVFDCVGAIFLGLSFSEENYNLRNSAIEVRWFNPDGKLEMTSKRPDYNSFDSHAFRWVGINLNRPQGGGLFSLLDHSAGMERFIGQWRAELWIAGEQFKTVQFEVQC